jgi:hypothetical protein
MLSELTGQLPLWPRSRGANASSDRGTQVWRTCYRWPGDRAGLAAGSCPVEITRQGGPAEPGRRFELPILSPEEVGSRLVHAAHDYWRSKIRRNRLPSRRDIDPVEIPKLLPHVLLTEISPEPFQARYRLAGTALADIYGFDYTGSVLSAEREGEEAYAYYLEIYRRLCREKQPLFGRDNAHVNNRHHIVYEWVELPLIDERGAVAMTFAVGELFRASHAVP